MEVFAAFTAQTDHEVGRMLDSIRDLGQSDNTLVMWEIGDNGASMEGTLNGVFNEMASLNGHDARTPHTSSSTSTRSAVRSPTTISRSAGRGR